MTFTRVVAAVFVLVFALALGACSSVSDAVSDHWPHFAGGEPNGLPPRPGTPGYDTYIAHKQPADGAAAPAASAAPGAAGQTAAVGGQSAVSGTQPTAYAAPSPQYQRPAAAPAPAVARPSNDPSGLY